MNDLSYTIRRADMADVDRLLELLLALQDHVEAANPDLWRMTVEARHHLGSLIAARVRAREACALVAEHSSEGVIGLIFGRIVTNSRYSPSRAGQVDQTYVCPEHRRAGVGTRLVSQLCRFFASEGVADVSLRFVPGNQEAAGFWAALGFSPRIVTVGASLDAVECRLAQVLGQQSSTSQAGP